MPNVAQSPSLYEQDILLWVEDTIAKLRTRDFDHLDLEHLIEEVESLGISQKKELLSRLIVLLEHLLKRLYVASPRNYNGWERTIRNQRTDLDVLIDQVPSLKSLWEITFEKAWGRALNKVRKEYKQASFPDQWQYPSDLETMLDRDFWESDFGDLSQ
jgi:hypothetical protein